MAKFEKGNQASLKHGGAAACKAITEGKEFTGLAREVEKGLQAEYDTAGALPLMVKNAIRLQTAADLYWQAIMGAAEAGDFQRFESLVKPWGWLSTAAARVLGNSIQLGRDKRSTSAQDVINALQGGDSGQ